MTTMVTRLGAATGSQIDISNGLQQKGRVIQTITVGSNDRVSYSASNSGIGTSIAVLELTITPQRADSTIWLRWVAFCEVHHDTVYTVIQDSSLIGWNDFTSPSAARWSGVYTPWYDAADNNATTPQVHTINWFQAAGSTAARTYKLGIRSANGTNRTYWLNRTYGSAGANNYEIGHSWGIAREIAA